MRFEVVSRTHVGMKRAINEDNVLVRPDLPLFVVADGMGGHDAGEVASGLIVQALEAFAPAPGSPLLGQLVALLGEVNGELRARAAGSGQVMGSTVVGIVTEGETAQVFWAGDSRAYLFRGTSLTQLTRDHSLVQELVDAGMLEADQAQAHPNANMITRAVGASDHLRVETAAQAIAPGDLLCLFSDGVTRVMTDAELAAALGSPAPLAEVADGIVWTVLQRGAPDNLTLVLVRLLEG